MDQPLLEVKEEEWVKIEKSMLKSGMPCIVDKSESPSNHGKEMVIPLLEQKTIMWGELENMCKCSKQVIGEPKVTLALARDGLDVTYCVVKCGIQNFPTITTDS